ncbi:DsrE/DsrF/TusD sulfur relay family protein [Nocardioides sp. T2.26MG-1]|uniref:DsrE/DsrF/TusD sulfur relay family protein n=1 Tax=Nocardioides sp. T2.26MG-1 TaxID=3041166 RepID=UPI0024777292|nr:DsrE family protein [Nocardioides sp. T2.26MG-1]CAI9416348.1 Protein YchN [Nocardioides sp. T2.26MG-1]
MRTLLIINGPAYGSDTTYNAVRLAVALAKKDDQDVHVFLMGDAVTVAMRNQKTPDGYYTLDRMLAAVPRSGGQVLCCGTCMDARGVGADMLMDHARRSTMDELADLTVAADKVLVF